MYIRILLVVVNTRARLLCLIRFETDVHVEYEDVPAKCHIKGEGAFMALLAVS